MNYALALSLSLSWFCGFGCMKRESYILSKKKIYLFCFIAKLNQGKAKSDIPISQNEESKIIYTTHNLPSCEKYYEI